MEQKCTGLLATISDTIVMSTFLLWGPKTPREDFKPDFYLQCILEEGLPFLLKSFYL